MDQFSFIGNSEIETIDQFYKKYLKDPGSVDESWRTFFQVLILQENFNLGPNQAMNNLTKNSGY